MVDFLDIVLPIPFRSLFSSSCVSSSSLLSLLEIFSMSPSINSLMSLIPIKFAPFIAKSLTSLCLFPTVWTELGRVLIRILFLG